MTNITPTPAVEISDTEYEHIADCLLDELQHLAVKMQKDCPEIERFKADTLRLEAENRVVLNRLKAMWC